MSGSQKSDRGGDIDRTVAGRPGESRRDILDMVRKAAIAGPILLTLKSTPAAAASDVSTHS